MTPCQQTRLGREPILCLHCRLSHDSLNLEFQEPPTAQAFVLAPPADAVIEGADGLSYHLVQAGAIASGDTREWTLSYAKDNSDLTAAGLVQPEASAPATAAPGTTGGADPTIWIFFGGFCSPDRGRRYRLLVGASNPTGFPCGAASTTATETKGRWTGRSISLSTCHYGSTFLSPLRR